MNLSPVFRQRFFDSNGLPLNAGLLYSYVAGTTTPLVTYSNSTGTTNTNPVVLDSKGYADVWLDPTLSYKFVLEDSSNNVQWTVDNVSYPLGISTWSTNITYSKGTVVQDSSGFGLLYVSLTNNNQGNALTSVSNWRVLNGNITSTSTNYTALVTDDFIRSNSTSGNVTITLPAISMTPVGKKITVKDVGTGGNTTTIVGSGSDTIDGNNTFAVPLSTEASASFTNNGTTWDSSGIAAPASITIQQFVGRTTGTSVGIGGIAVSSGSGSYTTTSLTMATVTNLSVTLTTTGRPVLVYLLGQNTFGGLTEVTTNASVSAVRAQYQVLRDSTVVGGLRLNSAVTSVTQFVPPPGLVAYDVPAAGSHTYAFQANTNDAGGTTTAGVLSCYLVAFEI